jgi:hypothetical protein
MNNRPRPRSKQKTALSPKGNMRATLDGTKDEVEIEKPPTPPTQPQELHWDVDEREHHRIERRYWYITAFLTVVAALGAIGTTVLSILSVREARKATSEAHRQADGLEKQTKISVRPWVGLTDDMNPLQTTQVGFNKDGDAQVTYEIISKNYSSAAATSVTANAKLLISIDIPYIFGAALDEACGDNYVGLSSWGGSVVFPGKSQHVIKSSSVAKKEDIKAGPDGRSEAWLVGCVGYRDQFGILYKTKFVYWYVDPRTFMAAQIVPSPNTEPSGQFIENHSSIE